MKEGINDGFLTPFKVKQIATTLDDYIYVPDDKIIEGEAEEGKRYREPEFNRTIEIEERERYRVKLFMDQIDQREKTLVFCATQAHALLVRDMINQLKTSMIQITACASRPMMVNVATNGCAHPSNSKHHEISAIMMKPKRSRAFPFDIRHVVGPFAIKARGPFSGLLLNFSVFRAMVAASLTLRFRRHQRWATALFRLS